MLGIIKSAIKTGLLDFIKETRKTLPARVAALVDAVSAWLPASVPKATALFQTGYNTASVALARFLNKAATLDPPKASTVDRLTLATGRVLTFVEAQAKKL